MEGITHTIFVYGTLREGFWNNRLLRCAQEQGSCELVGKGETHRPFLLTYDAIPFVSNMVDENGLGPCFVDEDFYYDNANNIKGEVYEVDEATFRRLDRLEGHPEFYTRFKTFIKMEDGTTKQAWLYFNNSAGPVTIPSGDFCDVKYEKKIIETKWR